MQTLVTQVEERSGLVERDVKLLEQLDRELARWQEGFRKELLQHQAALANILLRLEQRAMAFLDETMALGNLYSLVTNREGVKARFEKVVIGDLGRDVERQMQATVNWMLDRRYTFFC